MNIYNIKHNIQYFSTHFLSFLFFSKEQPPKKRFSSRVATFAKGLSPSGSFRRKQFKAVQKTISLDDTQKQPEKKAEVQVRIECNEQ